MELKNQILKFFANQQCYLNDDRELYFNDECYLIGYRHLIEETKLTRELLTPVVVGLRNERLIELVTAFDEDGAFRRGSGYILTDSGVKFCQENKLSDELTTPITGIKT